MEQMLSTLINSQRANMAVMEGTPNTAGSCWMPGQEKKKYKKKTTNTQGHRLTVRFHLYRPELRYIQMYSEPPCELIWEIEPLESVMNELKRESGTQTTVIVILSTGGLWKLEVAAADCQPIKQLERSQSQSSVIFIFYSFIYLDNMVKEILENCG